jgi:hypothetical protein
VAEEAGRTEGDREHNRVKAALLYDYLDQTSFYSARSPRTTVR